MKYRNLKFSKGINPHISGEEFHEPSRWSPPGSEGFWSKFSGWEPLMKIHHVYLHGKPSVVGEICDMSDYPDMAASGDWSGIRDTSREQLLEMMKVADAWMQKKNQTYPWLKA